eukprot:GHVU01099782.1.p1 GENE.GHVU01099782.1~~GHVU01099782.1.p1  ORF type:complete len:114 (+),score=14.24 GHVU01099782.1:1057-1398(+)
MCYRHNDDEEAHVHKFTRLIVGDNHEKRGRTWFHILRRHAASDSVGLENAAAFYIYDPGQDVWERTAENDYNIHVNEIPEDKPLKALALTMSNMGKEPEEMTYDCRPYLLSRY